MEARDGKMSLAASAERCYGTPLTLAVIPVCHLNCVHSRLTRRVTISNSSCLYQFTDISSSVLPGQTKYSNLFAAEADVVIWAHQDQLKLAPICLHS
jgi:Cft2 family RNA processing exonuclease